MLASQRLSDIIEKLEKYGRVSVKSLATDYRVTEDLIRKDLKKLEKQGLLDRVYGGAERKHNKFEASSINYRLQVDHTEKACIAQKALSLIKQGDFVFLDTSSTSYFIAKALVYTPIEVTVITDMLAIANLLSDASHITLICIGGQYQAYTGGFTGQLALGQIKGYTVDKAFISCRSVDTTKGVLIDGFVDIGSTKKAILDSARTKVVATMHKKYRSSGLYVFYQLEDVDYVITEVDLDAQIKKQLDTLKVRYL